MKNWHKDLLVGFIVIVVCCGLVVLFVTKPGLLLWLCLFGVTFGFFCLCSIIGEKIRNSRHYDNLIFYVKKVIKHGTLP